MLKPCNECGVKKKLTDFKPDKRLPDGRFGKCRVCCNKRQNARRAKKRGHTAEYYARFAKYRV